MSLKDVFHQRGLRALLRGGFSFLLGRRGHRRLRGWRLLYRLRALAILHARPLLRKHSSVGTVRLWVDRQAFRRVEKLLSRAVHTIAIQIFIWRDDETGRRIARIVVAAAERGVSVEITKEATGDMFELSEDFLTTRRYTRGVWHRLWHHPNIQVHYDTQLDHAKVFVIDDEILLLTGMNIGNEYRLRWHDYLVELRGTHFVREYLSPGSVRVVAHAPHLVMNRDDRLEIRPAIMRLLRSAQRSIVLEHAYLSDPEIVDALINKSKANVRVTVILPEHPDTHHNANMRSVSRLLAEGGTHVQILLYPGMSHAKVALIDRCRALLGFANLMTSSLDQMGEVNVLIDRKPRRALRKLRRMIYRDILRCRPLVSPPRFMWLRRLLALVRL